MATPAFLLEPQQELFAEDEVTVAALAQVFKQAFYKVSLDKENDSLQIHADGWVFWVSVQPNRTLIRIFTYYPFKDDVPWDLKLALVNRMNDEVVLVRFALTEDHPDVLEADYFLPFEQGLLIYQVVNAFRRFAHALTYAVKTYDKDGITLFTKGVPR